MWIQAGSTLVNTRHVVAVERGPDPRTKEPRVKVVLTRGPALILVGDEAARFLAALGFGQPNRGVVVDVDPTTGAPYA